jgi:hypothetical protein
MSQLTFPWDSPQHTDSAPKPGATANKAAERCRVAADAMDKHVLAKHDSANRMLAKLPTRKRLQDADSIRREATRLEPIQRTLRRLAELHENGAITAELASLTSKGAIESALFNATGGTAIQALYKRADCVESTTDNATIIVNRAVAEVDESVRELCGQGEGADWNNVLTKLTEGATEDQAGKETFYQSFTSDSQTVPVQNVLPKMSTVVYRTHVGKWKPWKINQSSFASQMLGEASISLTENTAYFITGKHDEGASIGQATATRQLGPSGRLLRKNSCGVPKVSECKPTDFSMPWMEARTNASSSTTNTVGVAADIIHAPRLWRVG